MRVRKGPRYMAVNRRDLTDYISVDSDGGNESGANQSNTSIREDSSLSDVSMELIPTE